MNLVELPPRPRVVGLRGILVLGIIALAGCASNPRYSIAPAHAMADDPALQSQTKAHRVEVRLLTPTYQVRAEELPGLQVTVENTSEKAVSLNPGSVAVYSGSSPVRVYTAAELLARIQKEAERKAGERSGESAEKIFQTSGARHDTSQAIVMVERAKMIDRASENRAAVPEKMAELANTIVPVRIGPGESGGGVIKLHAEDVVAGQPLRVVITVDEQPYEFVFSVKLPGS